MDRIEPTLNEWVVLALLAEGPKHGFALAKELRADGDLGRILTVHRAQVYRAVDRLVAAGLAAQDQTEPGDAGPVRTPLMITTVGNDRLDEWYHRPVDHIRDLRIEFLVKLRLTERAGRSPARLVDAQRSALAGPLARLSNAGAEDDGDEDDGDDVVDRWRRHSGGAAARFLDELADE